ncbi:ParB/RepB/Spo0J family partition protein [Acidicapsa dinghuensis]|uniref:ParB/RepB/Spo0J family partition protein n=1 Tax=Acidicapsa dinghuensis TaxID=2218256 RepID=A0ABW1EAS3_9BACT|nr:ParB/RepB/Spo0J family partition protein [Acidicapsa dinghuensis]
MTGAAAVAAQTEQDNWTDFASEIEEVVLAELEPSPFNARVIRHDESLGELAASIRLRGVQQPIIIRELPVEGEIVKLEIVAGHRRVEASKLAGKTTIPAIRRELTDDEARELQIVENLLRQELPALEEAQGFNDAMTLAKNRMLSVQDLAARLGKSPVYISRRLTLLDATPDVQDALRNGLIGVEHALELARLSESEQERLLAYLDIGYVAPDDREEDEEDDEEFDDEEVDGEEPEPGPLSRAGARQTSKSLHELRRYISQTTLRVLGEAPFDPNDGDLVSEAGSCGPCLKRSGANQLLFSDVEGEDVCTDRACFDAKVKAFVARKMAEAKAAKKPLHQITEEWNKKGPQVHYLYNGLREAGGKRCGFLVEAIHVDGRSIGKVVEICIGPECKVHGSRSSGSTRAVSSEKQKADRKALLAKVKVEKDYRLRLFKELIAKPVPDLPSADLVRALVMFAFTRIDSTKEAQFAEALGWDKDIFSWRGEKARAAKLMSLTPADAIRIALVGLEVNELTVHEHDVQGGRKEEIGFEKVAKLLGLDYASIRASIAAPSAAKATPKKVMKQAVTPAKAAAPTKKQAATATPKKAVAKPAKKAAKKKAVRR